MTSVAVWCEECEVYECPFCHDVTSDFPFIIDRHAKICPDRPGNQPVSDLGVRS